MQESTAEVMKTALAREGLGRASRMWKGMMESQSGLFLKEGMWDGLKRNWVQGLHPLFTCWGRRSRECGAVGVGG